jgi:hypothetical protein
LELVQSAQNRRRFTFDRTRHAAPVSDFPSLFSMVSLLFAFAESLTGSDSD